MSPNSTIAGLVEEVADDPGKAFDTAMALAATAAAWTLTSSHWRVSARRTPGFRQEALG
jgi:hypothetical protein